MIAIRQLKFNYLISGHPKPTVEQFTNQYVLSKRMKNLYLFHQANPNLSISANNTNFHLKTKPFRLYRFL